MTKKIVNFFSKILRVFLYDFVQNHKGPPVFSPLYAPAPPDIESRFPDLENAQGSPFPDFPNVDTFINQIFFNSPGFNDFFKTRAELAKQSGRGSPCTLA